MRSSLAVLATTLFSFTANAEELLVVRTDLPSTLRTREGKVVGTCDSNCSYLVDRGRYVLQVEGTSESPGGKRKIDVRGPTSVEVIAGSRLDRSIALTFALVGSVAVPVGLIGMALNLPNEERTGNERAAVAWGGVMFAGIGMMAAGWTWWFGSNTKIHVDRPGLVVVPTTGGGFARLTTTF